MPSSVRFEVEFHLSLPDHPRNGGCVQVAVPKDRHRPVGASLSPVHPPHAAQVHVSDLAGHARQRFDALDQDLLQLAGGAGGLSHLSSIAS